MPSKPNNKVLWIILISILIVGLGAGGYFIYKKQVNTTQQALNSSPAPKASSEILTSSRNDPNGPYYHQIYSATSTDGLTWQKQDKMLFDHASVPGVVSKNDKIYLYFVDASEAQDQLSVAISTDQGKTFSTKQKVIIQGSQTRPVADPHPELVDNKIRLYYLSGPPASSPDTKSTENFSIYSATSSDGINFDNPELAFESKNMITDPDVFETPQDWRMFLSEGTKLILTISTDNGKTFQQMEGFNWNRGAVSDTEKIGDDFRTFYCADAGIRSAIGANAETMTLEDGARIEAINDQIVCDPAIIKLGEQNYLMFYKTQKITPKNSPREN